MTKKGKGAAGRFSNDGSDTAFRCRPKQASCRLPHSSSPCPQSGQSPRREGFVIKLQDGTWFRTLHMREAVNVSDENEGVDTGDFEAVDPPPTRRVTGKTRVTERRSLNKNLLNQQLG